MLMPPAGNICCKECLAIVRICSYYVGSQLLERTRGCTSQKCNKGLLLIVLYVGNRLLSSYMHQGIHFLMAYNLGSTE